MSDMDDLGEFRDFEQEVRRGLSAKADAIAPGDRLHAILDAGEPRRRSVWWVVSAAAVFVLVAVMGVSYLVSSLGGSTASTVSGAAQPDRGAAQPETTPGESTKAGAMPSVSEVTAPSVPAGSWAMPVYAVVTGTGTQPWLLNRVFLRQSAPADTAAAVQMAVATLLTGQAPDGTRLNPYAIQQPWNTGTTATVTVADDAITIILNQPGRGGLTVQQQKIAVQSLVWTATAAAQKNVPVRVEVVHGRNAFVAAPAGTYERPAESYTDLVPIWIDVPSLGASVASPVTVTGEACVFEAQFSWELFQGRTVVASGNAMANSGCPVRGTYSIPLGSLAAGEYTIRVWEVSMKDGSVSYETSTTFTVT